VAGWWRCSRRGLLGFFVNENLGETPSPALARASLAPGPHLLTTFGDGAKQSSAAPLLLAAAELAWPRCWHRGRVVSLVAGALTAWPLYALTARRFGPPPPPSRCWASRAGASHQSPPRSASEALNLLLWMGVWALRSRAPVGAARCCSTRVRDAVRIVAVVRCSRGRSVALTAASSRCWLRRGRSVFAVAWLVGKTNWGRATRSSRSVQSTIPSRLVPGERASGGRRPTPHLPALLPGAAALMLTPLFAPQWADAAQGWSERRSLRWLVLLILVPVGLYTFAACHGQLRAARRFTMKELLLLCPSQAGARVRCGRKVAGAGRVRRGVVPRARPRTASSPTHAGPSRSARSPRRRAWSPPCASRRSGSSTTRAAAGGGRRSRGFDDLPLSYFSGRPFDEQLRRRYERFDEALGARARAGWRSSTREGCSVSEVTPIDAEHVGVPGQRFELRHSARVRVSSGRTEFLRSLSPRERVGERALRASALTPRA